MAGMHVVGATATRPRARSCDIFANLANCCNVVWEEGRQPKPPPDETIRSWRAMVAVALLPPNDVIEETDEEDGTSESRLGREGRGRTPKSSAADNLRSLIGW